VSPLIIYFEKIANITIVGTTASTITANIGPQFFKYSPLNAIIPSGSVRAALVLSITRDTKKSFQIVKKFITNTAETEFSEHGSTTLKNAFKLLHRLFLQTR